MPITRWVFAAAAGLLLWGAGVPAASGDVVVAGTPYRIKAWETDDGLPQNSIIAMTQTRDGYLWLGTLNGLVRFDGINFRVFDEGNAPELHSSRIVHLFEDSRQRLWIGTENAGVALLQNGRITSTGIGRDSRASHLTAAGEDASGAVWLYGTDGRVWRYQDGATNLFFFGSDRFSIEGTASRRAMIVEKSGPAWIGTDLRLATFAPTATLQPPALPERKDFPMAGNLDLLLAGQQGGVWRLAGGRIEKWSSNSLERAAVPYPWKSSLVTAACEDRQGNLIVGTRGEGVYWFDAEGRSTVISTNEGLSHPIVLSLCVDQEGTLWVGTDGGGLNRVNRQVFQVLEPTRGQVVQSVCEGADGGLWIGFNTIDTKAPGAARLKDGAWTTYGPGQGLERSVRSLFVDHAGEVWAGTLGGLFQLSAGSFHRLPNVAPIPNPFVLALHEDRNHRLCAGTVGGLFRLEERHWNSVLSGPGSPAGAVRAIAEDKEGDLWIGTEGGGLHRLRGEQITTFRKGPDALPSDTVSSLLFDEQGVLWVGTSGGLARYHEGRWTRYSTRHGLASDSIGYLLDDGQGQLWIGSNAGLMRVPKSALNDFVTGLTPRLPCRVYEKPDGLPTRECSLGSQPAAWRARDGTLWFPTIKGLASVHPARLLTNTNPPPVLIESVWIEGQAQESEGLRPALLETVTVPPGKQRLEIQYTSLNLAAPERARFKYRLEGHETAWTDAGHVRVAHYSKLPPGSYQFRVTACNEDGLWNPAGSTLAVIVEPPFWRTWWFLTGTVLALLGVLVAIVHYLSTQRLQRQLAALRQQEALDKERARIARDIHDQLGASLTQVALLGEMVESDKHEPLEIEAHGRQISQTARDTSRALDQIVWTVNPSNDTLEGLINYICKHAQEYLAVAGLHYRLDVPPQLPEAAISPEVRHNVFLAAKEAVTNVVRHAHAQSVWLRLKLEPSRFIIEIQDDGRGPAGMAGERAQSRNGLRNMGRRMEDVGGEFSIGPAPEGGTLVRLAAPMGRANTASR